MTREKKRSLLFRDLKKDFKLQAKTQLFRAHIANVVVHSKRFHHGV